MQQEKISSDLKIKIAILVLLLFGALSLNSIAAEQKLQWVGLYNGELLQWLENENQLAVLCPKSLPMEKLQACKSEKLRAKKLELSVFESPQVNNKIGSLVITATPGKGLTIAFQKQNTAQLVSFEPDLFDVDWGYGPYFHQTVLDQKGEWILLPALPLPQSGWINLADLKESIALVLRQAELETVYEMGNQSVVITKFTDTGITARSEQPSDMWCQEGDAPKLKSFTSCEIKYQDLFDLNRHLKIKPKYKRGC
jgi:hypothetical protein